MKTMANENCNRKRSKPAFIFFNYVFHLILIYGELTSGELTVRRNDSQELIHVGMACPAV